MIFLMKRVSIQKTAPMSAGSLAAAQRRRQLGRTGKLATHICLLFISIKFFLNIMLPVYTNEIYFPLLDMRIPTVNDIVGTDK